MTEHQDDAADLLRVITPYNLEADSELEALRAEHAALTARVAAMPLLSPIVLTPRVVAPLLAPPVECARCARQAAEFEDERKVLLRDRMLALKSAQTEQTKRLRVERALAESRATLARLRQARTAVTPAPRTGSNPRRYGAP